MSDFGLDLLAVVLLAFGVTFMDIARDEDGTARIVSTLVAGFLLAGFVGLVR